MWVEKLGGLDRSEKMMEKSVDDLIKGWFVEYIKVTARRRCDKKDG